MVFEAMLQCSTAVASQGLCSDRGVKLRPCHPQSVARQLRKPLSLSPALAPRTEEISWQGCENFEK